MAVLSCARRPVPTAVPAAPTTAVQVPRFQHVFVVVEENENYDQVIGNKKDMPYLNELAGHYGLAQNYFANTHPSLSNYFFLTAGRRGTRSPWIGDLSDDYPFAVPGENVASVLAAHGRTWKAYMENLPGAGYIGDDRFPYVKRHNPFAYFHTVRTQPDQRKNIVPFESFTDDLNHNSLPDYSFIAPNVYHDGHDDPEMHRLATCGDHKALQEVDGWLKDKIDPMVRSDTFVRGGLLIIVFDEACEGGTHADWRYERDHPNVKGGGRVPAIIISSQTPPGTISDVLYHHQSVLRLTLKALGIENAPGLASIAPDMSEFFPKPAVNSGSNPTHNPAKPEATSH